ncbi:choline BCCT transporter BetT [Xenorhabdus nematophila]|uniref:High-affinity choline transport protein (BCCT family) n=1 Tax=Xenorhabdus nematophila (strain ATCC 19061 / DSM 3370 / CCUG 14189 / LMG 1036 / NCIMB 9965 / AN6) TaxID=406817 RepID=D3VJ22_XENNA|nr:choline BCCT transporter BetT [Xenorhabdus nematophila]CBJ90879.1 high-affinity choline transport protein (BCCT family) [Xenorhabdus nematophila ATCC 19061]CCW29377.1 High-affinity choline transport protein [Xenorhabdus nematophila F1]CEK23713.1 high-affinity choline transport protein (BCCT family) [Xenorhabdus nematophila AN6/1]
MSQDNTGQVKTKTSINPPVFFFSAFLVIALATFAGLKPELAERWFKALQQDIFVNASWFYILAVALILLSVTYLGLSRYGNIKLGPDHAEPDFSYFSWFAMLFSAGMGIGLMFFGVAEPVMHYLSPPVGTPESIEAAKQAMKLTFFHWGLHAWAIYAIVALILAFFSYRHGLPLTLRSALYPIIGDKIYGPIGHAVDVFAVIGTVFGVATSLGYGVLQVNAGLNHLFGLPINSNVQVILIIAITALATLSVVSGLDRGIRILSELNLGLAVLLLILVVALGPTVLLLKSFVENTGGYLSEIVSKTFNLYAYEPKSSNWLGGWTLLYWGWWLSWSPFVGMFIARVSRGRTIREFVTGVLFVPSGFTLMWMTAFGNSSIDLIANKGAKELADIVQSDVSLALFNFLEHFPFPDVLSFIAIVMVVMFFVTSADSGAMVVDALASGGAKHTPVWQRIFWAGLMGVVAISLLIAGGLSALQTVTIASALPFSAILLISIYGLLKALRIDAYKKDSQQMTTIAPPASRNPIPWQRRLRNIVYYPKRSQVKRFMTEVIQNSMKLVAEELDKQNKDAVISDEMNDRIHLEVDFGENLNFVYEVRLRNYIQPAFAIAGLNDDEKSEEQKYYRAEVYLKEGGQDYDLMGWTQEQIIHDILDQYEKHIHFLHLVR